MTRQGSAADDLISHRVAHRRRSRWGRRLLLLVVVPLLVAVLAPVVVSKSELRNKIVPWIAPEISASVVVDKMRLNWFAPVELEGVHVIDHAGAEILEVSQVHGSKPLWQIVTNRTNLGEFVIQQPKLEVVLDENGSNLARLLDELAGAEGEAAEEPTASRTGITVEVVDGRMLVRDEVMGTQCLVDDVDLHLTLPRAVENPVSVRLSANAIHNDNQGSLAGHFDWSRPAVVSPTDLGQGQLELRAEAFPLAALAPILRRTQADISMEGTLDTAWNGKWNTSDQGPSLYIEGTCGLKDLVLAWPAMLGADRIASQQTSITARGTVDQQHLNLESTEATWELGEVQAHGFIPLDELLSEDLPAVLTSAAARYEFAASGKMDVHKLAAMLPTTMRIREDTRITRGNVTVTLSSRNIDGKREIQSELITEDIEAIAAGRPIAWQQPLQMAFLGADVGDGFELNELTCRSEFLQVDANGGVASGRFSAEGDLDRLMNQVAQFCDLGELQLTGNVSGNGTWNRESDGVFSVAVDLTVQQFSLTSGEQTPWTEDRLTANLAARLWPTGHQIQRVEQLRLAVRSGADSFTAELASAIDNDTGESTTLPLNCQLQGRAETWLARLRPWVSSDQWTAQGDVTAESLLVYSPQTIQLKQLNAEFANLTVIAGNWRIQDPRVRVDATVVWDQQSGMLQLPELTGTSTAVALRGSQLGIPIDALAGSTGVLAFRGDLAKLAQGYQQVGLPRNYQLAGQMQGEVRLTKRDGQLGFNLQSQCENFVYASRTTGAHSQLGWKPMWQEPLLQLTLQGQFAAAASSVYFDQFQVAGEAAQVKARGAVSQLATVPIADLTGEVDYDLRLLSRKLDTHLGTQVAMEGRHRQPFTIRGPVRPGAVPLQPSGATLPNSAIRLVSPELTAETAIKWDAARGYGFALGPQQFGVRLADGVLTTDPINTAVSGGLLALSPRLELNQNPLALTLDQNTYAQGVRITPRMCEEWLKYVAPLVAGVATADGQMSASVTAARIPIAAPSQADISGVVTIEHARVQPGPLAQQLLTLTRDIGTLTNQQGLPSSLMDQGQTWLEIQQQQVEFQMTQGRVYHRNMQIVVGDVAVTTQGWVGVDQTIGLVAQVPVQDKWIGNSPVLAGLKGQTLQIPIQGTLSQPQLDRRALANLSQQMIGNTAERFIQGELEKGLKKLLGPK